MTKKRWNDELWAVLIALASSAAIIVVIHELIGGFKEAERSSKQIPWLELVLVVTVVAAFVKNEVLSVLRHIIRLTRHQQIELQRLDLKEVIILTAVVLVSAGIYFYLG
ncbi:MAG: hypothetical protein ACREX4_24020 [Gammaproteobacteria bacterium]